MSNAGFVVHGDVKDRKRLAAQLGVAVFALMSGPVEAETADLQFFHKFYSIIDS